MSALPEGVFLTAVDAVVCYPIPHTPPRKLSHPSNDQCKREDKAQPLAPIQDNSETPVKTQSSPGIG